MTTLVGGAIIERLDKPSSYVEARARSRVPLSVYESNYIDRQGISRPFCTRNNDNPLCWESFFLHNRRTNLRTLLKVLTYLVAFKE